jgi:hypothetical protein
MREPALPAMARRYVPCLLAFTLLVPTLAAQSLWWDEAISLHLATSSWAEVVTNRAANIHPPLYFFALKVWVGLVGRTPFAARYLSALAATLLPAAGYRFARRRGGARAGRATALLLALAPPFLMYGQETRAYAMLPLLTLALLAQVWPAREGRGPLAPGPRWAARLALIQVAFVLSHYAGAVAVGWANVALLARLLRARDRRAWRAWARSVAGTALLAAPWALAVLATGAVGFTREAGLGNALAEPVPAGYLLRLLGVFHAVGMPAALGDALLTRPAALTGALLALAWAGYVLRAPPPRRAVIRRLALAWALPMTAAPVIWTLSPQAHPRYLLPFVLPAWMLGAVVAIGPRPARLGRNPLGMALLAAMLTLSVLGLRAYLTDPAYARTDVRGAAAHIRAEARPGDVALQPYTDWTLEQYDLGPARAAMVPDPAEGAAVAATLADAVPPGSRVYALDYERGALDPRGQVRALLARGGWSAEVARFHGVFLEVYEVPYPIAPLTCAPIPVTCVAGDGPCLVGVAAQPRPESGAALPVALCWEGVGQARYAAGLRLYAPSGALVAGADDLLLDARRRPTDRWAGDAVVTYHRVPLPVGLLPQPYRLEAGVYVAGQPDAPLTLVREGTPPAPAHTMAEVTPAVEPWLDSATYAIGPREDLAPDLRLEGARLDRTTVYPGQPVFVTLRWRALRALHASSTAWGTDGSPRLLLRQGGMTLDAVPLLTDLPPVPAGRPLLEHVPLTAPAQAEDGPAEVVLTHGARAIELGAVDVPVGERTFIAPPAPYPVGQRVGDVATLLGFDLAPGTTLRSGAPVTLTLIWRAETGAPATDLTVFAHLLNEDGDIVAQHDGKPVAGSRPTGGWLPGEILIDSHVLRWQQDAAGPGIVRVGLYNAATGVRVTWQDGADALTLPVAPEIRP